MSSKKNTDHVVAHDGTNGFWGLECKHCLVRQAMPSPCAITVYVAAGKAFEKLHADCTKP